MKFCTLVWNPKSKIEFVTGKNPTIPSPISPNFHPRNAFSVAMSEHGTDEACHCGQIMAFDSSNDPSRRLLYSCTVNIAKMLQLRVFNHNLEILFQCTCISNWQR